jgi:tRNA (cytidine/uridine-2'-O-)-methyltransferase
MRLALFQPEIAGNVGTILRTAACFGVAVDIIEPCGFAFAERALKRAGMDYAAEAECERHAGWHEFAAARQAARIILFTTKGAAPLPDFAFTSGDILLFGSESAGVPPHVHAAADARVVIPLRPGFRSLNLAVAAGIGLGEALRQTGGFSPC